MRVSRKWMMIAASAVPAMAIAADTVTMQPGRWEIKMEMVSGMIGTMPLPAEVIGKSEVDHSCVTPAEAANPQAYFMSNQSGDSCTPSGTAANGKLAISATCISKDMNGTMTMTGTYSAQAYTIQALTQGTLGGAKFTANSRISGRHVGACRGDEEVQ